MSKDEWKPGQLVVGWSLTRLCNLRCPHCYAASGKRSSDELNLEQCRTVVDKLKEAGTVAINFGGGECVLRDDFIDLCSYINQQGIKISYTSNGTVYSRLKNHLDLFHDIGVSIDFGTEERHDAFRGNGVFTQATGMLEHLVKQGVDNEMVTCLTKQNCSIKELESLYHLGARLGIDSWRINRFRPNGRGIPNRNTLELNIEDLKCAYTYLNQFHNPLVSTPEPIFRSAFGGKYYYPGDPSGNTSFRIQPNGEVSPSVFLSTSGGNILTQSVSEILNSEFFHAIRNRSPRGKCLVCSAYGHCRGGDAGASYLAYGHYNGPDPLCWLEPSEINTDVNQNLKGGWNVHELYLCTLYIPLPKNG